MKRIMNLLFAGVLMSALCAGFVACDSTNVENQNNGTPASVEQSNVEDQPNGDEQLNGDEQPSEITLTDAYYWGGDEKIPIERIEGKFMVMFYSENEAQFMDALAKAGAKVSEVERAHIEFSSNRKRATVEGDFEKIEDALALTFYWDNYYRQEDGRDAWTDGRFTVGLSFLEFDPYPLVEKMAEENGVEIASGGLFYCTNDSKGNVIEMANLFHESGLCEWAEPSLAGIFQLY
jgi:hypothetical protein